MFKERMEKELSAKIETFEKEKENYEKDIKETKEYYEDLIRRAKIVDKYKKNPPKTKEELKELQSVLCFGSLAYCCASIRARDTKEGKPCLFREQVLAVMGKSLDDYEKFKDKVKGDVDRWLLSH